MHVCYNAGLLLLTITNYSVPVAASTSLQDWQVMSVTHAAYNYVGLLATHVSPVSEAGVGAVVVLPQGHLARDQLVL